MKPEDTEYGRCQATAKSSGNQCGRAAVGEHGKCDIHGGKSPGGQKGNNGGAPKGSANAQKHGLYANPSKMYERLSHDQKMRVNALASALGRRVERVRGDVDEFDRYMCERLGVRLYQLELAEDWMGEAAGETDHGHLLIEQYIIGQDAEGKPVEVEQPNRIIDAMQTLSNDARMWMKDLGLLDDPTSQVAESNDNLASAIRDASGT